MRELIRSNDPVKLSWLEALLRDQGIHGFILDTHTAILEGSAGAILRRMMVLDDDYDEACLVLREADETPWEGG